jgi:hypothetical protein
MSWTFSSELAWVVFTERVATIGDRNIDFLAPFLSSILPQGPNAGVYSSSNIESYKRWEEDKPEDGSES